MPQNDVRQTFKSNQFRMEEEVRNDLMAVEFRDEDPDDLTANPLRMWANKVTGEVKYTVDGVNVQGLGTKAQLQEIEEQLTDKASRTKEDITLYVNPITGSDYNGGLTPESAFATIQQAINSIPNVVDHNYVVQLADGIYTTQNATINGANIDTYSTGTSNCLAFVTNKNIHEGASITILGNAANKENVIMDGQGTANYGIFIMNTKRVNIKGLTVKSCAQYCIHYKRYSTGQLKNVATDGAQYGLFAYQYSFVEIQGDTEIKNATVNGILVQTFAYLNATGLTMTGNSAGILLSGSSEVELGSAFAACSLTSSGENLTVGTSAYITCEGVAFGSKIGTVNGGKLKLTNCSCTFNVSDGLLYIKKGHAEINSPTFASGATPSTVTGLGIFVQENSTLYVNGGSIDGFYQNISISGNSRGYIEGTNIRNARFDGLNINKSTAYGKNITSSINNGRYGVRIINGSFFDDSGNTVTGNTAQFDATDALWQTRSGATANRPASFIDTGTPYFDTTLGHMIWYNGTVWKDATGTTV